MLQLKSANHFSDIGRELFANDDCGDILLVTDNVTFSAHSLLLLQNVQLLPDLVCDQCRLAHEKIVIILPDTESDLVEIALREFYIKGDSRKLNSIFSVTSVKENYTETLTSKDTDNSYIHDNEKSIGYSLLESKEQSFNDDLVQDASDNQIDNDKSEDIYYGGDSDQS